MSFNNSEQPDPRNSQTPGQPSQPAGSSSQPNPIPERLVDRHIRRYLSQQSHLTEAKDDETLLPGGETTTQAFTGSTFVNHPDDTPVTEMEDGTTIVSSVSGEYDETIRTSLAEDDTLVNPPGDVSERLPRPALTTDVGATQVMPSAYQRGVHNVLPDVHGVSPRRRSVANAPMPGFENSGSAAYHVRSQAEESRKKAEARQRYLQSLANQPGGPKPPERNGGRPPFRGKGGGNLPRKEKGTVFVRLIIVFFVLTFLVLAGMSYGLYRYYQIASILPDVNSLRERASQFETTRILDRNGNVLYEINDPNQGRRTYVPLKDISPNLIAATIATEDKDFYENPGFDVLGIMRALYQNYTSGEVVSGASTVTQQLARLLLMSQSERYEQNADRKAREIILAAEITRRYTKDEIMELYLNEIYYGNMAYGIQAASETYFHKKAAELTVAEAAFLAGLPQSPSVYDIFNNRDATLIRNRQVLVLMYTLSNERNCIDVQTPQSKVCMDAAQAAVAADEISNYPFEQSVGTIRYPHWVFYIRSLLESMYDPQTIYRSGFTVYTTLDPDLQDFAQQTVTHQVAQLANNQAFGGALVSIQPSTGEILALVGSPDFHNEAASGQINMAVSPRQPGSSIKPLTFAAAFEKGWTPATLIWDVPTDFPPSGRKDDTQPPYQPVNYSGVFRGPVTVRTALANSLNIPAVKALEFVGIYDDPDTPQEEGFIRFAERLGIDTLTRDDYGLSLTLGGGDVTLLQLTSAFGVFAANGVRQTPIAITRILDSRGNDVYVHVPSQGEQVIRPEYAYLISDILSDNEARSMEFGSNSVLNLPFRAAAKTGTTNDFRDNWTIGYTPDLVTGVWVGNPDYTPMINTTGMTGAAPIWSEFMQFAVYKVTGGNPSPFYRPNAIIEKIICSVSGTEPSEWCPSERSELFTRDQPPLSKQDDLWQKININTWSGLLASPYCAGFTDEKMAIQVSDPFAVRWLQETDEGRSWAESYGFESPFFFKPERECKENDLQPTIEFVGLTSGQMIEERPLDIYAIVNSQQDFSRFRLEWGKGDDPEDWEELMSSNNQYIKPEKLLSWDMQDVKDKTITLRIYAESTRSTYAEKKIVLRLHLPEPTPTPTLPPVYTPTPTPTEINIYLPSNTPSPATPQPPEPASTP